MILEKVFFQVRQVNWVSVDKKLLLVCMNIFYDVPDRSDLKSRLISFRFAITISLIFCHNWKLDLKHWVKKLIVFKPVFKISETTVTDEKNRPTS